MPRIQIEKRLILAPGEAERSGLGLEVDENGDTVLMFAKEGVAARVMWTPQEAEAMGVRFIQAGLLGRQKGPRT